MRPSSGRVLLLATLLVATAGTSAGASSTASGESSAAARDAAVTVTSVDVSSTVPLADGFGTVRVDVGLESAAPLPDTLTDCYEGCGWIEMAQASNVFTGGWQVTRVADLGTEDHWDTVEVSDQEAVAAVGQGAAPPWAMVPTPVAVRVVTGDETWVPRARLVDRRTGAGIRAPYRLAEERVDYSVSQPAGWRAAATDANGYTTEAPLTVRNGGFPTVYTHAYGGRGSRGFSLEASATLQAQVKWQASARYAVSGRSVVVTGNAWPAPVVFAAQNPGIHLQRLDAGRWVTVTTATVRANGRYTLSWTAPADGTLTLRVYKPGGVGSDGASSVGTQLAATTVSVGG